MSDEEDISPQAREWKELAAKEAINVEIDEALRRLASAQLKGKIEHLRIYTAIRPEGVVVSLGRPGGMKVPYAVVDKKTGKLKRVTAADGIVQLSDSKK
jgi:hypothetical protein